MTREWNNASWMARPERPLVERAPSRPLRLALERHSQAPLVLHARVCNGNGGGPDKTIFRAARHVDPTRYRVAAAYLHPRGDRGRQVIAEQAAAFGCALHQIEEGGAVDPRAVWRMLQLVRRLNVAVWHAHDYKSDVLGLLLRPLWPMKLVTTVHGFTNETPRTRLYARIDNLTLARYDAVVAVSPPLRDHCLAHGVAARDLTYLPNGVDTDDYRPTLGQGAARRALGIAPERLVVGCVGRLSSEKGQGRAVRTAARLARKFPQLELHLVGDGPDRARLEQMAAQLGIAERVKFWGWQTDTPRFYEAMDVMLLPSRTEGMPNAVLEAMAMNVPTVATDVGGVRDLLDGGRCGVVVTQDETEWPAHLAPLLKDAAWRRELAAAARRRVTQRFSFRQRCAAELDVYDKLLRVGAAGPLRRAA